MEILDLYKIAENENISFYYDNMKKCNAAYYNNCILLNKKIINTKLEKEVIAEELAHHFCGIMPTLPFSTDYYNKLIRSKNEYIARKWLINEVIPLDKLKLFLKQNMSKYDIADELNISVSLVDEAFNIYKENLESYIYE